MGSAHPSPSEWGAPSSRVDEHSRAGQFVLPTANSSARARRLRADRARQVADVLRRQVLRAAFPGGVLPDGRALVAEFGVTRNAIRGALNILRGEGLIDRTLCRWR